MPIYAPDTPQNHPIEDRNYDVRMYNSDIGWVNIEDQFNCHYVKCIGLNAKGKPKNIVTEGYAESDRLNVYIPENITREPTKIELHVLFDGEYRQRNYTMFYNFCKKGIVKYWDNQRKKLAEMYLEDAVEPTDDLFVGSSPYILVAFKFQNINGECMDSQSI